MDTSPSIDTVGVHQREKFLHRKFQEARDCRGDRPWVVVPRGLSRHEAAAFVGLSPTAFDNARREGKYPNPTLPGKRYDRSLLEKAMDNLSGLATDSIQPALDKWRTSRGSREN